MMKPSVFFVRAFLTATTASGEYDRCASVQDGTGLGGWRGDHVISSQDEMNAALKQYNDTGLFLEFFLPWCGHSRRLRPEFRRASAVMAGKPVFARVDCSSPGGARICLQFDVQYHPHMLLMTKGTSYEYTQRATASEMCRFCRRVLGEHYTQVKTLGEIVALLEDEQVLVAAFVDAETSIPAYFVDTARVLKDQLRFVTLQGPVLAEAFGITTPAPTVVLLRLHQKSLHWTDSPPHADGQSEETRFSEWLTAHSEKLVENISQENFNRKMGEGVPVLLLFRDDSAASDTALKALYKSAAQLRGALNVVSVNGARYQKLAVKLGVRARALPALVLVDVGNATQFVYPPTAPFVPDEVLAFVQRVLAGAEPATLRSAQAPVYEDGPVYTLVADRFQLAALDPAKDVVVNFRTRWCGFCNLFAPTYRELALTLAHVETVVFYDFDADLNDPDPILNISSFPTLMLFSAHNKSAITYMGDRRSALPPHTLSHSCSRALDESRSSQKLLLLISDP